MGPFVPVIEIPMQCYEYEYFDVFAKLKNSFSVHSEYMMFYDVVILASHGEHCDVFLRRLC